VDHRDRASRAEIPRRSWSVYCIAVLLYRMAGMPCFENGLMAWHRGALTEN